MPQVGEAEHLRAQADACNRYSGRILSGVCYYTMSFHDDGLTVEQPDWDRGWWHYATFAVEFTLVDDSGMFVSWRLNPLEGAFSPEIREGPVERYVGFGGVPFLPVKVDASSSSRWRPLLGKPIDVSLDLQFQGTGEESVQSLRVGLGDQVVLIGTGAPSTWDPFERFHYGTDDLVIVFARTLPPATAFEN